MSDQVEFKPGELVQLLSGGPVMTVKSLPNDEAKMLRALRHGPGEIYCVWFNGKKLEGAHFDPGTIKKVVPEEGKP